MRRTNYTVFILNFQFDWDAPITSCLFSIFNSIETHQLHIVYSQFSIRLRRTNYILFNFYWCNMSRLYNDFQFSIFNSIRLRRTNYTVFIFIGVMCHVSTMIFNFQFSIFNSIETHQLHRVYSQWCNVSRLYINYQLSIFNFQFNQMRFLFQFANFI